MPLIFVKIEKEKENKYKKQKQKQIKTKTKSKTKTKTKTKKTKQCIVHNHHFPVVKCVPIYNNNTSLLLCVVSLYSFFF